MNVLVVYPGNPDTFWSFKHVLKFVSKKSAFPPLGLLTVAAMLPRRWNRRRSLQVRGNCRLPWNFPSSVTTSARSQAVCES